MTEPTKQPSQKPIPYPDKTTGSDVAAQVRKVANNLTETQRAEMFERGMRIIYGGNGNCATKVRS